MAATGNIPIRVLPGQSELVRDNGTGQYHLNVGFHISFNVKEMMQALSKMTDLDVTIKADAAVPMAPERPAAPGAEDGPPKKENVPFQGLGGPLKSGSEVKKEKGDLKGEEITFDTKLLHLAPATGEYRARNAYKLSDAAFCLYDPTKVPPPAEAATEKEKEEGEKKKEEGDDAAEPAPEEPKKTSQEKIDGELQQDCKQQ